MLLSATDFWVNIRTQYFRKLKQDYDKRNNDIRQLIKKSLVPLAHSTQHNYFSLTSLNVDMYDSSSKFACSSPTAVSSFRLSSFYISSSSLSLLWNKRASQQCRSTSTMTSQSYSVCQSFPLSDCLSVPGFVFEPLSVTNHKGTQSAVSLPLNVLCFSCLKLLLSIALASPQFKAQRTQNGTKQQNVLLIESFRIQRLIWQILMYFCYTAARWKLTIHSQVDITVTSWDLLGRAS